MSLVWNPQPCSNRCKQLHYLLIWSHRETVHRDKEEWRLQGFCSTVTFHQHQRTSCSTSCLYMKENNKNQGSILHMWPPLGKESWFLVTLNLYNDKHWVLDFYLCTFSAQNTNYSLISSVEVQTTSSGFENSNWHLMSSEDQSHLVTMPSHHTHHCHNESRQLWFWWFW